MQLVALHGGKRRIGQHGSAHARADRLGGLKIGSAGQRDPEGPGTGHTLDLFAHPPANRKRHGHGRQGIGYRLWGLLGDGYRDEQRMPDIAKHRVLEPRHEGILPHECHVVDALACASDHFPRLLVEKLEHHVRLGFGNGLQPRQEQPMRDAVRGNNPRGPFPPPAACGIIGQALEVLPADRGQFAASLSDFEPPAFAPDQLHAEEGFQFANLPAHERLPGGITFGDAGDGSRIGYSAKAGEALHRKSGLGKEILIHNSEVILCAFSAIGKFQPSAYREGVKEIDQTKGSEGGLEESVDGSLAQMSSERMNQHYLCGRGYSELGILEEARMEFESVPIEDDWYIAARRELMKLADPADPSEQGRKADEGLRLIAEGCRDSDLINMTALGLHFAGRPREAYDLTHEYSEFLEWMPIDFYGMATYASRVGEWEDAAWHLSIGMAKKLSASYSKMFADLDLEPLFRHAAEGEMKIHTALCLANPFLTVALSAFADAGGEVDGILYQEMPSEFRPHMFCEHVPSGSYFLSPTSPLEIRQRFHAWFRSVNDRVLTLAKRSFERARLVVLDAQLDFAIAAAKRGDFFAARHHAVFAMNSRQDCFDAFDAALSPLGLAYFFDDIREAWWQDEAFRALAKAMTPTTTVCPDKEMELLEDCTSAAKATTFWILGRAAAARSLEGDRAGMDWNIEVIRRWPDDPTAFHNILRIYENIGAWDTAALVLANVPPAFHHLSGAENLIKRIETRGGEYGKAPRYSAFYGQPDMGGVVGPEGLPGGWTVESAAALPCQKPVDKTNPETSQQL